MPPSSTAGRHETVPPHSVVWRLIEAKPACRRCFHHLIARSARPIIEASECFRFDWIKGVAPVNVKPSDSMNTTKMLFFKNLPSDTSDRSSKPLSVCRHAQAITGSITVSDKADPLC